MGGAMNPQGGYQWGGGQGMGGGVWGQRGGFQGPPAAQGGINYGVPNQPAAPASAQAMQGGVNFGNPADQPIRAIDGVVAGNAPGMPSFNAGTGGSIWPSPQQTTLPQGQPNGFAPWGGWQPPAGEAMQPAPQDAGIFRMQAPQQDAGVFPMQQGQSSLTPPPSPPGFNIWNQR
jgi:hypothetical protein